MKMEIDSPPHGKILSSVITNISEIADVSVAPNISVPESSVGTSSKLNLPKDSLKLEYQFVRLPFELYRKKILSNHSLVKKQVSNVIDAVSQVADTAGLTRDDAVQQLTSLAYSLQGVKAKLEEECKAETKQACRCRVRLHHLESLNEKNLSDWIDTRLKRILVDYMLRMSYYDTAKMIAKIYNIEDLVDNDLYHLFSEAKEVIESLKNKDLGPAFTWCADNKYRIKKKGKFEFHLKLQKYIEMVRAGDALGAVMFSRKHLAPWGGTHMTEELQRVLATAFFTTKCQTYKDLFEPKQWDILVDLFKQEFYESHAMTLEPLLNIYLQTGLMLLKTPFSYETKCTKEDPLSQENFRKLASELPYSNTSNSKLFCYISNQPLDENNLPLALPNGYVYGTKALKEMAEKHNGKITCPRTGLVCEYDKLDKVLVVA